MAALTLPTPPVESIHSFKKGKDMTDDMIPAVTANEQEPTDNPTIHLSGDDGQMVSQATQIVLHKYDNGDLTIEIFPNDRVEKHLPYFIFNLTFIAQVKLREFLNCPVTH